MENGSEWIARLYRVCLFVKNKYAWCVKPGSEEMNIICALVNALQLYIAFRMNELPPGVNSGHKSINMKAIDQQLYDYIDTQKNCELTTGKGLVISTPDTDWLKAEFSWVDTDDTILSVFLNCPATDFVKTLQIRSIYDIEDLTQGSLMELYYEGLAEILCFITLEYTYGMSFKKLGNSIIAENERGVKHNIPAFKKVETRDQYLSYTTEYYRLIECNEN